MNRVVIDTNVIVSALLKADTAPRRLLTLCFDVLVCPLMGNALFSECLDVLSRDRIFNECAIDPVEREIVFDAFLGACLWVNIYFRWRPNLSDEADNHLIELAVAGNANYIITGNKKDFVRAELVFPKLKIISAREFIDLFEVST